LFSLSKAQPKDRQIGPARFARFTTQVTFFSNCKRSPPAATGKLRAILPLLEDRVQG